MSTDWSSMPSRTVDGPVDPVYIRLVFPAIYTTCLAPKLSPSFFVRLARRKPTVCAPFDTAVRQNSKDDHRYSVTLRKHSRWIDLRLCPSWLWLFRQLPPSHMHCDSRLRHTGQPQCYKPRKSRMHPLIAAVLPDRDKTIVRYCMVVSKSHCKTVVDM